MIKILLMLQNKLQHYRGTLIKKTESRTLQKKKKKKRIGTVCTLKFQVSFNITSERNAGFDEHNLKALAKSRHKVNNFNHLMLFSSSTFSNNPMSIFIHSPILLFLEILIKIMWKLVRGSKKWLKNWRIFWNLYCVFEFWRVN